MGCIFFCRFRNDTFMKKNCPNKNPAYRRHWISWCVRIVKTDTKTNRNRQKGKKKKKIKNMSHVRYHVSWVMCQSVMFHILRVTCHLSLTLTATDTDPPPANSPIMHSRRFEKTKIRNNNKNHGNNKKPKTSRGMPILAIINQKSHSFSFTCGWNMSPYGQILLSKHVNL